MTRNWILGTIACFGIMMAAAGCEKSEKVERFPEGTSMLKMMNEDNGGTRLGNSDVHITSAGNFRSGSMPIMDCGETDGIGGIGLPDFMNMAPEVAVIPGHGYVICPSDAVRTFPSRKKAIIENELIYRVFVDSWITSEEKTVGANVYFLLGTPLKSGQMLQTGSNIGTLSWDDSSYSSRTVSISLPDEDIEVQGANKILTFSTRGKTLTVGLSSRPFDYETGDYSFLLRSGRVYTQVSVSVQNNS